MKVRVLRIEPYLAMQGHKVGNFMVKDDILGLDLGYGQKSLRIKLLIRRNRTSRERWAFLRNAGRLWPAFPFLVKIVYVGCTGWNLGRS